jgi:hypothetical protein
VGQVDYQGKCVAINGHFNIFHFVLLFLNSGRPPADTPIVAQSGLSVKYLFIMGACCPVLLSVAQSFSVVNTVQGTRKEGIPSGVLRLWQQRRRTGRTGPSGARS